jgi:hypothetical protein
MSSWQLATPDGDLGVGGWRVEARLDSAPSGDAVPSITLPAALAVAPGDGDVVRHVHVQRAEL